MKKLLMVFACTGMFLWLFAGKGLSPLPVVTNQLTPVSLDLGGTWYFNPSPAAGAEQNNKANTTWPKIEVPGEWAMQGFTVEKNHWAGYSRSFEVPAGWKDMRIKLRCDAVYSESELYINGVKIGTHFGGFTPFEFDITNHIKPGTGAVIYIKVKNEGMADSLASGSQYAVHPLGGITRKIRLIALPQTHLSSIQAVTRFDKDYNDAILSAQVQIANESKAAINNASLLFELMMPGSNEKILSKKVPLTAAIKASDTLNATYDFPVPHPAKWDTEHPNLYQLKVTLETADNTEITQRNIGFRQIEVRGNQLMVNNHPVKIRGVCRHEVMPLRGRSLTGDQWVQDALIFREANVNYIRTSHYPPAEEFVQACDSLGIFLEVEAPFCWADGTDVPEKMYNTAILQQMEEMVNFFKSNPSVLVWSLANESQSAYDKYFKKSGELVKQLDPTRPRIYNQYGDEGDHGELELENQHYPGPGGPAKYYNNKRPVIFGEYAHLNAYNRLELVTDPGLRDAWGIGLNSMWEKMYAAPAVAGGAIWAGIDDTFILPDGKVVGYGTWGPIDGWRRRKPEYWHMKKIYSPVKLKLKSNFSNDSIAFSIENRMLFSNLNECRLQWQAGKQTGVWKPSLAPGSRGDFSLAIHDKLTSADSLYINVYDPRNVLIDQYAFAVVAETIETNDKKNAAIPAIKYQRNENNITAILPGMLVMLDKSTGAITITKSSLKEPLAEFGRLMLLPLNGDGKGTQMTGEPQDFAPLTNTCANRIIKKVEYNCASTGFKVTVWDDYDEASGYTAYDFSNGEDVRITYHYSLNKDINPRQWGLVLTLPGNFDKLSWKRKGLWNFYPQDHIGRLSGEANALSIAPVSGPAGPVQKPGWSWSQDRNDLGTNDFRSTKMNILEATLSKNSSFIKVKSDGSQHVRTWKEDGKTKLLVAAYSNLGAERFFRGHAEKFDKPLKQGDTVEGTIQLEVH